MNVQTIKYFVMLWKCVYKSYVMMHLRCIGEVMMSNYEYEWCEKGRLTTMFAEDSKRLRGGICERVPFSEVVESSTEFVLLAQLTSPQNSVSRTIGNHNCLKIRNLHCIMNNFYERWWIVNNNLQVIKRWNMKSSSNRFHNSSIGSILLGLFVDISMYKYNTIVI
jgi:hypothetical protein